MITKEQFIKVIEFHSIFEKGVHRIEEALGGKPYSLTGLWESDWITGHSKMFDLFIESHFSESGCDLVFWWYYEDVPKIIYEKIDSNLFDKEKEVKINIKSIDDLWTYMIKHKEEYFLG